MPTNPINRRTFSKLFAGSLLSGSVLEAAVQESRETGTLSDSTAMTLLEHIGYKPTLPDELKTLKPMLERTIKDLQTIRDFELPISLEPAFVFHPLASGPPTASTGTPLRGLLDGGRSPHAADK